MEEVMNYYIGGLKSKSQAYLHVFCYRDREFWLRSCWKRALSGSSGVLAYRSDVASLVV